MHLSFCIIFAFAYVCAQWYMNMHVHVLDFFGGQWIFLSARSCRSYKIMGRECVQVSSRVLHTYEYAILVSPPAYSQHKEAAMKP